MDTYTTLATVVLNIVLFFSIKEICANYVNDTVGRMTHPMYRIERNGTFETRIVNGLLAHLGDFRGIISMQNRMGQHFCGGTLITDRIVLTAAHCVILPIPKEDMQIVGDDLSPSWEATASAQRQVRKVTKIIWNPGYYKSSKLIMNDVAVVFVDPPFKLTNTFGPVPLPDSDVINNQTCSVAGWGTDRFDKDARSSIELQAVNVSVVPQDICRQGYSKIYAFVGDDSVCAGPLKGVQGFCSGDSGGGLICNGSVYGIVSHSVQCALENFPGVYMNVYHYKKWIEEAKVSGAPSNRNAFTATISAVIFILYFIQCS